MQAMRAIFFDLLTWFRGDMRVGAIPAITITAGNTGQINVAPSDASEEWEVLTAHAIDSATIDATDTIEWNYADIPANIAPILQSSTAQVSNFSTGNRCTFPHRDTTKAIVNFAQTNFYTGFICRRKDNNAPWLALQANWKASATIGSRSVSVVFVYRRRRLI
jgi:hypothetical protein